jgi:hypothetical protein
MKFNHEKWDRLLRKQQAMHKQYIQLSIDWHAANDNAGKIEAVFVGGNDASRKALRIIKEDKKLSAADLEQRMEVIKTNWTAFITEYGLQDGAGFQSSLLLVYSAYLDAKKMYELRERQSQINADFMASMGRLKEFAKGYIKADGNAFAPVN